MEHQDPEVANKKDNFQRKSSHSKDLIPVLSVNHKQKANKSERTSHLSKEDIIQQNIKVKYFPIILTELVGREERDGYCD